MIRTGNGIDFHKFNRKRKLFLGGLELKEDFGLEGHSDADVLIHSICDSLLGALGKGDIGDFFPDSDNKWKDRESTYFLLEILELVDKKGYEILNVDVTIISEKPKISKYKNDIVENLSKIMKLKKSSISIKATTTEKMGFLGREEGMCAISTVTLMDKKLKKILEDMKNER